jgi:PBP1b-binding outer membrane lipoprotein LpoB
MKTLLSTMIVTTVLLTACGENTDTPVNEEPVVTPVVETTAEEQEAPSVENMDKPSFSASRSMTATAKVEAINHATREITVVQEDGNKLSFIVSEEARNLDQVQLGDLVITSYVENMTAEVISVENAEAGAGVITGLARAEEGEMPGAIKSKTVVVTAIVEEINIEANTFKLKGPEGNVEEFTARNPENLKKAAVGDLVVITHTKAIALTVEKVK